MGKRACGYRNPGAVYLRTLLSNRGLPPENFLFDPPIPCPKDLLIPNRGVSIIERPDDSGVYDVYDRIGETYYPNCADFFEEFKKMGLSRRIKRDSRFDKLSPQSRIYLVHPRAIITNAHEYYRALGDEKVDYSGAHPWYCRCTIEEHKSLVDLVPQGAPTCVSLWYDDIQGGALLNDPDQPPRLTERKIGDTTYYGYKRPAGVTPQYAEGIFLGLPIHRFDVIADPVNGEHEKALEHTKNSTLPTKVVKE